ncbi:MAG: sulfotransferase [Cyanobacteria bacterium J06560_6]
MTQTEHKQNQAIEPIFLVGCPRSGTTLLQQILDAHPAIAIAPETHFVRKFWHQRDRYGSLDNDDNYSALIQDLIAIDEFAEMQLHAETFQQQAKQISRTYSEVFALLLSTFAANNNATIVGEKTPNHVLSMAILQQFFPAARFINIVRDPRAVVNSWRSVPWSTNSIQGDALVWKKYVRAAQRSPIPSTYLLTIQYEQLVVETERVLQQICQFIQQPYHPHMLNFHQRDTALVNISREPWKENSTKPVSQSALTKWQQHLSKDAIAQIEAITFNEMIALGYQPTTPANKLRIPKGKEQIKSVFRPFLTKLRAR